MTGLRNYLKRQFLEYTNTCQSLAVLYQIQNVLETSPRTSLVAPWWSALKILWSVFFVLAYLSRCWKLGQKQLPGSSPQEVWGPEIPIHWSLPWISLHSLDGEPLGEDTLFLRQGKRRASQHRDRDSVTGEHLALPLYLLLFLAQFVSGLPFLHFLSGVSGFLCLGKFLPTLPFPESSHLASPLPNALIQGNGDLITLTPAAPDSFKTTFKNTPVKLVKAQATSAPLIVFIVSYTVGRLCLLCIY